VSAGQYRSFQQVILTQHNRAGAELIPSSRSLPIDLAAQRISRAASAAPANRGLLTTCEGFVSGGAADLRPTLPAAYWDFPFGVIGVFSRDWTS
jgi:antitoxin (DNA-binding transcriptional repressor) of toxin-antitoxin stability system